MPSTHTLSFTNSREPSLPPRLPPPPSSTSLLPDALSNRPSRKPRSRSSTLTVSPNFRPSHQLTLVLEVQIACRPSVTSSLSPTLAMFPPPRSSRGKSPMESSPLVSNLRLSTFFARRRVESTAFFRSVFATSPFSRTYRLTSGKSTDGLFLRSLPHRDSSSLRHLARATS